MKKRAYVDPGAFRQALDACQHIEQFLSREGVLS